MLIKMETEAAGGGGSTILWENPDPTQNFTAQTINIPDISKYDRIIVWAQYTTTRSDKIGGFVLASGLVEAVAIDIINAGRTATLVSDGVQISAPAAGDPNNYIIPTSIEGVVI